MSDGAEAVGTVDPTAPAVRFVSEEGRAGSVELKFPVVSDGVTISTINFHRLTAAQVVELTDDLVKPGFDDFDLFAFVTDQPPFILRGLDGDDWLAVREVGMGFLPSRFRAAAGWTGPEPAA